jgi:hypothetical protein
MTRLSSTEKAVALIGTVLLIGGIYAAVFPQAMVISHPGDDHWRAVRGIPASQDELVSAEKSRVYGIVCAALGAGVAWLPFFRPGKK